MHHLPAGYRLPTGPHFADLQVNTKLPGGCHKGELTLLGQGQAQELGGWLRHRYVDDLGLLSPGTTVSPKFRSHFVLPCLDFKQLHPDSASPRALASGSDKPMAMVLSSVTNRQRSVLHVVLIAPDSA